MQANVTDDLELVLRWRDGGESTVRFALASSSEFTVTVHVCRERGLNYQGDTTIALQTMCYGHDLDRFSAELRSMVQGAAASARFINTGEDFEIRIAPHERDGRRVTMSELRYRHHSDVGDSELVLPVGTAEDLLQTATAITEIIRLLKVDCRSLFDLPR